MGGAAGGEGRRVPGEAETLVETRFHWGDILVMEAVRVGRGVKTVGLMALSLIP